jgi:hypothetical protein
MQIKQRHLHPTLLNWIANTLQLGPDVGLVHYLVANKTTDLFYLQLVKKGYPNDLIYTSYAAAYAAMTAGQNDTLLVFPGTYTLTANVSLTKSYTHVLGTVNNILGDPTQGGCAITATAEVVTTSFDITGDYCKFVNLKVSNIGAFATSVAAVHLAGAGAWFNNCNIVGIWDAAQIASANPYSLGIGKGGYFPLFENCVIGTNVGATRTQANSSHLKFTGTGAGSYMPDNGIFRRCIFNSSSNTATTPMIRMVINSIDRIWLYDECVFYNFAAATGTAVNQVFDDEDTYYTHQSVLKRCTAVGFTEWQTADIGFGSVQSDMPITGTAGGLAKQPTGTVGN